MSSRYQSCTSCQSCILLIRSDHVDQNEKAQAHAATSRSVRLPKGPHGGVELLLIHSVEHVGKQGQVVEVRPGYAYNYLIPHGLATLATTITSGWSTSTR